MLTKSELQRLRALREKKYREALGLFLVEGEKVVAELLAAEFPFVEIYATPAWKGSPRHRAGSPPAAEGSPPVRVIPITPDEMARASHFPTPSSVLAIGRIARSPLPAGALDRGLTLALDGVQNAGNVGTLLRIADWFAFDRVVLSPDCADLFHQKVINASMGSFARVRVHTVDLGAVLACLRDGGGTGGAPGRTAGSGPGGRVPVLGCDLAGEDVHSVPPVRDAVVVIGSEGRGLSPAVAACVTHRITIRRFGAAESLNAAVAAAIVCDNLRRRQA